MSRCTLLIAIIEKDEGIYRKTIINLLCLPLFDKVNLESEKEEECESCLYIFRVTMVACK